MSDSEENDLNAIAAASSHHNVGYPENNDDGGESNHEESDEAPNEQPPPPLPAHRHSRSPDPVPAKRSRPNEHAERTSPTADSASSVSSNSHVVASHYNTLEEKGLDERSKSRIVHMRNFNNWIKSVLINEFIEKIRDTSKLGVALRVLDMCCGKGGDLYKWEKANITHLICTDIAAVSVEQCEIRYKSMVDRNSNGRFGGKIFTAEFMACDSTRTQLREKYNDPSIELSLVSCQFAFHYCFESLKQAECMMRNAAECLKTGGYFIGTIPDAYEIVRRQRAAGTTEFGNELYKISFMCDADCPPLFGGKYNFQLQGVVDCPEFLVHFPLLVKLARKYGLELVMKESFGGYFNRMVEKSRGLIQKMQGLQAYPPDEPLTDAIREQFGHAAEYLATKEDRYKKCGTLSKDEWEATSLYIVFAFRKLKKQWNDKGQPEFV